MARKGFSLCFPQTGPLSTLNKHGTLQHMGPYFSAISVDLVCLTTLSGLSLSDRKFQFIRPLQHGASSWLWSRLAKCHICVSRTPLFPFTLTHGAKTILWLRASCTSRSKQRPLDSSCSWKIFSLTMQTNQQLPSHPGRAFFGRKWWVMNTINITHRHTTIANKHRFKARFRNKTTIKEEVWKTLDIGWEVSALKFFFQFSKVAEISNTVLTIKEGLILGKGAKSLVGKGT